MTRVVCRPLAPRLGEFEANQRAVLDAIDAARDADILVLPELVTTGYVFHTRAEAADAAIGAEGPELAAWSAALTGDTVVVAGFAERGEDGVIHNSAALVGTDGVRAVHRKAHLWDREKLFFTPGDRPPPVVDTAFGRVAVLICYDLEFPEYTRRAALDGADLLAVPVNWPLVPRPEGERPPEVVIAQAAALVNRVAVACCDRGGTERGQRWTEGTTLIGSDGWVVATATTDDPAGARAELDLLAGRDKRLTDHCDLFGDRRPELYGG
ncbi:nitrilase-related carbon-nitrogen hydrolase [Streptomyces tsukubensis]|uniref:Hydrolase n=1 Tax=Streptomyces tsukubensis TaxID=83656 RepID=A0A1V4AD18_9ACTN|nr:nitrilase-related carbon-nitrogen hydrolase [Streptomyces tsukubensis]OON81864.1 hydrolase [Streptomyces tsukubensis]QFR96653.1 hydrolase [Streptomyces tsukubensis]